MDTSKRIEILFDKRTNAISLTFMALTMGCHLQNNFSRKSYAIDNGTLGVIVADIGEQTRLMLTKVLEANKQMTPITLNIQLFEKPIVANLGILSHLGANPNPMQYWMNNMSLALGLNKTYEPSEQGFVRFTEDVHNSAKDKPVHGFPAFPNFGFATAGSTSPVDDGTWVPPGILLVEDVAADEVINGKRVVKGHAELGKVIKTTDEEGRVTLH